VARQLVEAALLPPPLAQTETAPAKVAESPR
jgi:hypothetical protein